MSPVCEQRWPKVEEVRREVAGLKAELSDCHPKMKKDMTNLELEHRKLKGEMREVQLWKAAMADQRLGHEQEICDVRQEVELL
jgi:hypothetical protein